MFVDLRAAFDTRVFATDASSRSCAAVVSQLPVALLKEIWRFRPRRGVGQRYDVEARDGVAEASSDQSDVDSDSEENCGDGRWASELCSAVGWQPVFRYTVRRCEHIVTKEARPICTLIRHLASEVRPGVLESFLLRTRHRTLVLGRRVDLVQNVSIDICGRTLLTCF